MKPFTEDELRRIVDNSFIEPFLSPQAELHEAAAHILCKEAEKNGCNGEAILLASMAFAIGRATGIREERARRQQST